MEPGAGGSKQDIRERIWDYMESENVADFPRPVHHRIPNFKGASRAAEHFPRLQVFRTARTIKVNPDAPQKNACFLVLDSKKTLLVPTPRLRTGLFNRITPPPGANKEMLRKCATSQRNQCLRLPLVPPAPSWERVGIPPALVWRSRNTLPCRGCPSQGVRDFSVPVGLDSRVLVDLVVVGSVAVSEKGWRIGKGEGYADLEYAMMVSMGAVHKGTPVVTIVHDCQVVDIPEALLEDHDLTVDYILTPTRVISTGCKRPKPAGITWSKISPEMLGKIPVLRSLRDREKRAGMDVALQAEHQPFLGSASQHPALPGTVRRPHNAPRPGADSLEAACGPREGEDAPTATVCVGNLPHDARVRDLKRALRELRVAPLQLSWRGPQHRALLHYRDLAAAQQAVSCLQGLHLGDSALTVALARPHNKSPGGCPGS
ncbi:methenyltetrahydrofolate synthase domain-containing protein isoform X4 [Marmota marmota marmota]|uniref:methenyltetrahydrofolate synthase domain-containing protein isoform X4 n=1 Tax=Marmota marmota marmota TaxID=9994 RepID=UPI002093BC00|nr:methenyltetrahydrofolate synthase domain-containing protein isoform X4 [Marmota marmota marmota]